MKINLAIEKYLVHIERKFKPSTLSSYSLCLNRFNKLTDSVNLVDLSEIKKVHINKFKDEISNQISKNTSNQYMNILRSFLIYLSLKNIKALPSSSIKLSKQKKSKYVFLSSDEVKRLIKSVKSDSIDGLRDTAIIEILLTTGIKLSDLIELNIDNLDLNKGKIIINKKNFFLSENALKTLKFYILERKDLDDALFIRHSGNAKLVSTDGFLRLSPEGVERVLRKHGKRARINKKVTPLVLRHTFATLLMREGADLQGVQKLLHHKDPHSTGIYLNQQKVNPKNTLDNYMPDLD